MTIQGQAIRSDDPAGSPGLPVSIAFLIRHGVAWAVLAEAARIAVACDVEPDEALIRAGLVDEAFVYRALARESGLPFLPGPLPIHAMARFPEACLAGLVPLAVPALDGVARYAYAPRGAAFGALVENERPVAPGIAIVTPTALRRDVLGARADQIAAFAADSLPRASPALSAREGLSLPQCLVCLWAALGLGLGFVFWPLATWLWLTTISAAGFLGVTVLRLASVSEAVPPTPPDLPRLNDRVLPIYTILVPLFRETRILPRLIAAIAALDYPAPKLDVKFILEAEDDEMIRAVAETALPGFVEVIVAPRGQPRTKPRALNVALPLARGAFVTIYDAEDVPDPGQLRLAVSTFLRSASDIACLQARLVIDNTGDALITRLFTLEYGALFDVLNPALSRFDMPIPLGGTSNHFRGIR